MLEPFAWSSEIEYNPFQFLIGLDITLKIVVNSWRTFLAIFIHFPSLHKTFHNVIVDLTVTLKKSEYLTLKEKKISISTSKEDQLIGWTRFINITELINEDVQEPTVQVSAVFHLSLNKCNFSVKDSIIEVLDDIKSLYEDDFSSDITINVGGKKLKAHKVLLIARSSGFAAMFRHNMIENQTNNIFIEDIHFDAVKEMLCFMYTGKIDSISNPIQLMAAADKYDIHTLKLMCVDLLVAGVNLNNCCSLIQYAELFHSKELKEAVIIFMAENFYELQIREDFSELTRRNPELLTNINTSRN